MSSSSQQQTPSRGRPLKERIATFLCAILPLGATAVCCYYTHTENKRVAGGECDENGTFTPSEQEMQLPSKEIWMMIGAVETFWLGSNLMVWWIAPPRTLRAKFAAMCAIATGVISVLGLKDALQGSLELENASLCDDDDGELNENSGWVLAATPIAYYMVKTIETYVRVLGIKMYNEQFDDYNTLEARGWHYIQNDVVGQQRQRFLPVLALFPVVAVSTSSWKEERDTAEIIGSALSVTSVLITAFL